MGGSVLASLGPFQQMWIAREAPCQGLLYQSTGSLKPEALSPKNPKALNPKALNPKTLNPKPETPKP